MITKSFFLLSCACVLVPALGAAEQTATFISTGEGVQTAAHWPFTIELFTVTHEMKVLPAAHTRQAIADSDTDKRITLRMLREIEVQYLKTGLKDRYQLNGYTGFSEIDQLLKPLDMPTLAPGATITISYDATEKRTTLTQGANSASVEGTDFMQATWRIWFGHSKPASLGDQLINKIAKPL